MIEPERNRTRIGILSLQEEKRRPLILDGAVGTLLHERKIPFDKNLWSSFANISNQLEVERVHNDYVNAGAEIITTNTFRTNPVACKSSNLQISNYDLVKKSVEIVKKVVGNKKIIIAGSNAPAEDCYQRERTIRQSDLEYNHKKHIEWLWESGCDIILNETQSHLDEIEIIGKFCSENSIPFIISLYFDDNLNILSGEKLQDMIDVIQSYSPLAIGFNCIKHDLIFRLTDSTDLPKRFGFYLNCGAGHVNDENLKCGISSNAYVDGIKPLLGLNPLFVGSCCGSNPNHTKAIKKHFMDVYGN